MDGEASPNQDSLRMREVSDLVGLWRVTAGKTMCTLSFSGERIDSANAWRVVDRAGCLAGIVPGVVGWRPAPDGIELASADRRTIVMFDAAGQARAPGGGVLSLERAAE